MAMGLNATLISRLGGKAGLQSLSLDPSHYAIVGAAAATQTPAAATPTKQGRKHH